MLTEAIAIREAVEGYRELRQEAQLQGKTVPVEKRDAFYARALCACIECAHVNEFPEHPTYETWRFSPARYAVQFFELLLEALLDIYYGEQTETSPNA